MGTIKSVSLDEKYYCHGPANCSQRPHDYIENGARNAHDSGHNLHED
jgi:hypothetical protein